METAFTPAEGGAKDTNFTRKHSLNLGGRLHVLNRPWVMGILNLTHDSFHAASRATHEKQIREKLREMIKAGADMIDLGAASSRPGAALSEPASEMESLKPALEILRTEYPGLPVSVDTYWSDVARFAIDHGAHLINDISGGSIDQKMFLTAAELKVPYVLMHIKGKPQDMQHNPGYNDVFREVCYYFSDKLSQLLELGMNDIILDPGFGFGKTVEHNYDLFNHLPDFQMFGRPLLVGISRKSMINKVLDISSQQALNGTTVLNTMALMRGASLLRVHDVKEAVEAVKLVTFTQNLP